MTAKIARARLNEFPEYYARLARMEARRRRTGSRRASERADVVAVVLRILRAAPGE